MSTSQSQISFSVVVGYKRRQGIQDTTGANLKITDKVGGASGTFFHATLTGSTTQIAAATALIRDAEDRHRQWAERRKADRENFQVNSPAPALSTPIRSTTTPTKTRNQFEALTQLDGQFPSDVKKAFDECGVLVDEKVLGNIVTELNSFRNLPTDERELEAAELGFTMEQLEAAEALEKMDFQEEVQLELVEQDYREELTTADEYNSDPTHISDGNDGKFVFTSNLKLLAKRERQARNKAAKGKTLSYADCFRQEYIPPAPKSFIIGSWADYFD